MANSNGRDFVLNGVGAAYISSVVNGKTVYKKCGTLQEMKLSFSASDDKVYGGDSMQPIYIITKDSACTVTFTDAVFNLEYLQLTAGADMSNQGSLIFNVDPVLVSGSTYTVTGRTNIDPTSCIVLVSDDVDGRVNQQSLTYNNDASALGSSEFNITADGVMKFGAALDSKYVSINGVYSDEESRKATFTTASIPSFVEIRHTSMPVEMSTGVKVRLHTRIFKARSTGKLDIDHKRQSAATPELEFEVMYDTSRTDDHIMEITQEIVK